MSEPASLQVIRNDDAGFRKFLEETPPDVVSVRPLSYYQEEIADYFELGDQHYGSTLPWSKTHDRFRIRPGELTVWTGYNFHGKSLLVGQVILWLVRQGESALIASMEMKPIHTGVRLIRQAAGSNQPTREWQKRFLDWVGDKILVYDQYGDVGARRILDITRYAASRKQCKHIVIDSLMKIRIEKGDYEGQKMIVNSLQGLAQSHNCHIHLIAHLKKDKDESHRPNRYDISGAAEISDQADNVVIVWKNRAKEEALKKRDLTDEERERWAGIADCSLIVDKQRHGTADTSTFKLWLHPASLQYTPSSNGKAMRYLEDGTLGKFDVTGDGVGYTPGDEDYEPGTE